MWERNLLEQLARESLEERRRARRWGIFWKGSALALVVLVLGLVAVTVGSREKICLDRCTALVEVRGELDATGRASAERVIAGLQAAFKHTGTKGVVVRVNSPGGSPVQAGQIFAEMRRLRGAHPDTPLYVVVDEIAASGGYYVAAAGDQIFVDQASIVGSIGVIMEGFGLVGAIDKLGVERRVLTSGENKDMLDPFVPVDPKQRAYVQQLLDEVHEQFIDAVRTGRGARLKEEPAMFSGLVWHGRRAIELGLADALGNLTYVAREVVKAEEIVDFTPEDDLADRVARRFGATLGGGIGGTVRSALRGAGPGWR